VAKRKRKHGGRRPGAGRKPVLDDPAGLFVSLEREHLEALQAEAAEAGITVPELVRRLVAKHLTRRTRR
jgi:hypothetical protein